MIVRILTRLGLPARAAVLTGAAAGAGEQGHCAQPDGADQKLPPLKVVRQGSKITFCQRPVLSLRAH